MMLGGDRHLLDMCCDLDPTACVLVFEFFVSVTVALPLSVVLLLNSKISKTKNKTKKQTLATQLLLVLTFIIDRA